MINPMEELLLSAPFLLPSFRFRFPPALIHAHAAFFRESERGNSFAYTFHHNDHLFSKYTILFKSRKSFEASLEANACHKSAHSSIERAYLQVLPKKRRAPGTLKVVLQDLTHFVIWREAKR